MTRPRPREFVWMALAALLAAVYATGYVERGVLDAEQNMGATRQVTETVGKVRVALAPEPTVHHLATPAPSTTRDCLKIRVRDGRAEWLRVQVTHIYATGWFSRECHYGPVWKAVANEHRGMP